MATDDFNDMQPRRIEYYLFFNPDADARVGHNIAILKGGHRIPYTDMKTKDTYYGLDDGHPLIGLAIKAIVFESDIIDYDLSNRTDLPTADEARRIAFDTTEAARKEFRPSKGPKNKR